MTESQIITNNYIYADNIKICWQKPVLQVKGTKMKFSYLQYCWVIMTYLHFRRSISQFLPNQHYKCKGNRWKGKEIWPDYFIHMRKYLKDLEKLHNWESKFVEERYLKNTVEIAYSVIGTFLHHSIPNSRYISILFLSTISFQLITHSLLEVSMILRETTWIKQVNMK